MSSVDAGPYTGRVLVLDDHDQVRHMLCMALQVAGFETLEAGSPYEAYRRLAAGRAPQAMLIDVQEPETVGLEVLRYVRAHTAMQDMPVIFLAGQTSPDLHWRALTSGADWFFSKPLSLRELQARVGSLVRQGRPFAVQTRR
jgi:two-component system phosphate regulon response regulator PhoB